MDEVQNTEVTYVTTDVHEAKVKSLTTELDAIKESVRGLRSEVKSIVADYQASVIGNEITDEDAEVFSINDVNLILKTLENVGIYEQIEMTRTFTADVTVTLSFKVLVEAKNEDEAEALVNDQVYGNPYERYFDSVEGWESYTDIEDVSIEISE
jgi:hypothetical protein